jgi:replicative DNA helicase
VHKLISDAEEDIVNIDEVGKSKLELIGKSNLVARRQEGLKTRYYSKPIFSGWDGFDNLLSNGFVPGKLSVVAGRTSMGKSMFKSNMTISMCNTGVGVLNICPEQGFDSEHDRIDAIKTGKHLKVISRLRELKLGDPTFEMLKDSSQKIVDTWNYVCVPTRSITVAGVRSAIRRSRRMGTEINMVFIDLFDRLKDVNVAADRTGQISVKLGQLEQIADEEQVHICILVQINRAPEGRRDKRPTLADLRDCGSYEQDADIVFLLYREGYYNKDLPDNIMEVNIAKQRDGPSAVFEFAIMSKEALQISPMGEKRMVDALNVQGG